MKKTANQHEQAQDLHEHRHDPGEWSERAVSIEVRPAQTTVVSCRMPIDEFEALAVAARAARESVSEYVRKAVVQRRGSGGSQEQAGGAPRILRVYVNTSDFTADQNAPESLFKLAG